MRLKYEDLWVTWIRVDVETALYRHAESSLPYLHVGKYFF